MRLKRESWTRIVLANSSARDATLLVLIALAEHADPCGITSVSIGDLMDLARVSKSQVKRSIDALIMAGELCLVSAGKGRGNLSMYRILVQPDRPFLKQIKGSIRLTLLGHEKGSSAAPF